MPTPRWVRASRTSSSRAPSTGCTTRRRRCSLTAQFSRVDQTPTPTTSLPELLATSTLASTGTSSRPSPPFGLRLTSPPSRSVEKFYPDYFTAARPVPTGIPETLTYGGNYFDIELSAADVGEVKNLDNTIVTLVRPGFSTHAMNMGQRFVQLYVPLLPPRIAETDAALAQKLDLHRLPHRLSNPPRLPTPSKPRHPPPRPRPPLRSRQRRPLHGPMGDMRFRRPWRAEGFGDAGSAGFDGGRWGSLE